jgi:flavin reductase (DIM6/NTAB) family NADH-FMN oxidoreductase RutF
LGRPFDELVGALDYPMFVVTTADGRRRAGCLVGFAAQCSIDPLRFMVWLSTQNHTHEVAARADTVAVHVLPHDALELATLFGSRSGFDVDKFARCSWHDGEDGVPLLDGCPTRFTGRILRRIDTGDHTGLLLEPTSVGPGTDLGRQLGFQAVRHLSPGNEA